jgi:undecaprenyl-diphosphatase
MAIRDRTSTPATRERDPAGGLGPRLGLASLAAVLVLIPFSLLLVIARQPLNGVDAGVAHRLHEYAHANPEMTTALIVWTDVFGPWPWRAAVALLAFWMLRRGVRRLAAWAITTITVGGLLGLAVKILVDRARPLFPDPVALAPGEAFPSGHAMTVTLGAGVIVLVIRRGLSSWGRRIAVAVAVFMVLSVSYTRVALGVHWVSDVLGGIVLGVAVLAATTAAFESWRRETALAGFSGRRGVSPGVSADSASPRRAE